MKKLNTTGFITLIVGFLVIACNDHEAVDTTTSTTVATPGENISLSNPEWDDKLSEVANMMKEQKEPKYIIDHVRSAAVNADPVFPYLQSVMAGDSGEDKKSASLFLFTTGFMLVSNGYVDVPSKAQTYIDSLVNGSKPAEKLLDNLDLVPTYKNYRYAIGKNVGQDETPR